MSTPTYPGRYVVQSAEADRLAEALYLLGEELVAGTLTASNADAVVRIDAARDALEQVVGDLDDIARRAVHGGVPD